MSRYLKVGFAISAALTCACLSFAAQQQPAPPTAPAGKLPAEIVERIKAELMDDAELQDCLQDENEEPVDIEEVLSAEPLELGSGHQGTVVRGSGDCLCGPGGNCEVWVFEIGRVPRLLLRASAVQEVTTRESASNGYRDLVTAMHGSATDSDLSVYQFDGKEYRLKECLHRTWTDEQGHRLKQPRLVPSSCEKQ